MKQLPIENLLESGLVQKLYTGAACAYGRVERGGGEVSFQVTMGHTGQDKREPVSGDTLFDLASLTKVLCTAPLVAKAVSSGLIKLKEKPFSSWPDTNISSLLSHTSGLKSYEPFYEIAKSGPELKTHLFSSVPRPGKGHVRVYSDLGYMALGELLEKKLGLSLDKAFQKWVQPLYGTSDLGFRRVPSSRITNGIASSGYCSFRKRALLGEVNDSNAFVLNGVAGHAGLFGGLHEVTQAVKWHMEELFARHSAPSHLLRKFAFMSNGLAPMAYDFPTPGGSTGGYLSALSRGHLGYTGVSFWVEPTPKGANYYVLLCNRQHHLGGDSKFRATRIHFHKLAKQILRAA